VLDARTERRNDKKGTYLDGDGFYGLDLELSESTAIMVFWVLWILMKWTPNMPSLALAR
jgi:hypothetical protein